MSVLVICQILGRFVKTLATNNKFCLRNTKVLPQTMQMELPKEQVTFLHFLLYF